MTAILIFLGVIVAIVLLVIGTRVLERRLGGNQGYKPLKSKSQPYREPPTRKAEPSGSIKVSLVADYKDAQPGKLFKFANDASNVIRVGRKKPVGAHMIICRDASVTGISQQEYQSNAISFMSGSERSLELVPDPGNSYDRNAIKVIGSWTDSSGHRRSGQIGWVPKEIAAELVEDNDVKKHYASLRTMYVPGEGKGPGIRFDIWG